MVAWRISGYGSSFLFNILVGIYSSLSLQDKSFFMVSTGSTSLLWTCIKPGKNQGENVEGEYNNMRKFHRNRHIGLPKGPDTTSNIMN